MWKQWKRLFIIPTKTKDNLPSFLDLKPKACKAVKKYGNCNLASMSVEVMSQYIHHMVLPQIIEDEWKEKLRAGEMNASEPQGYEKELKTLLKWYGLTCICLGMVYRWTKKLGFNYRPRKKGIMLTAMKRKLLWTTNGALLNITCRASNKCFGGTNRRGRSPGVRNTKKNYLPTVGMPTIILKLAEKCGSTMLTLATCFKREWMSKHHLEETEVWGLQRVKCW